MWSMSEILGMQGRYLKLFANGENTLLSLTISQFRSQHDYVKPCKQPRGKQGGNIKGSPPEEAITSHKVISLISTRGKFGVTYSREKYLGLPHWTVWANIYIKIIGFDWTWCLLLVLVQQLEGALCQTRIGERSWYFIFTSTSSCL